MYTTHSGSGYQPTTQTNKTYSPSPDHYASSTSGTTYGTFLPLNLKPLLTQLHISMGMALIHTSGNALLLLSRLPTFASPEVDGVE